MDAKPFPSVFASLRDRGLLSPEEQESLQAVPVGRARLSVKTRSAPAPIIWPAQHCKPDLLTKCAAHFGAGLVEAEVIPIGDEGPVYFGFEISPELLTELVPTPAPGSNGEAGPFDADDAMSIVFQIMQKLVEGQNQTNAILSQLVNGRDSTLDAIREALDQAFLSQVQVFRDNVKAKPPTVKEMMTEATGAIKEVMNANAEAVKQMRSIVPQQSEAAAYVESILAKATSPEVKQAAAGMLRALGAKNLQPTPVVYNPADVDPPGQTPPMHGDGQE